MPFLGFVLEVLMPVQDVQAVGLGQDVQVVSLVQDVQVVSQDVLVVSLGQVVLVQIAPSLMGWTERRVQIERVDQKTCLMDHPFPFGQDEPSADLGVWVVPSSDQGDPAFLLDLAFQDAFGYPGNQDRHLDTQTLTFC